MYTWNAACSRRRWRSLCFCSRNATQAAIAATPTPLANAIVGVIHSIGTTLPPGLFYRPRGSAWRLPGAPLKVSDSNVMGYATFTSSATAFSETALASEASSAGIPDSPALCETGVRIGRGSEVLVPFVYPRQFRVEGHFVTLKSFWMLRDTLRPVDENLSACLGLPPVQPVPGPVQTSKFARVLGSVLAWSHQRAKTTFPMSANAFSRALSRTSI
jgi:hypothetical protein